MACFVNWISSNEGIVSDFVKDFIISIIVSIFGGIVVHLFRAIKEEKDFKNGKIEIKLYNKIGINFWWNYFLKVIILGAELFSIAFYYMVLMILAGVTIICLNIRSLVESHFVAVWIIVVIFVTILFFYKRVKDNFTLSKKIIVIGLTIIGCIWTAIQITLIRYNEIVLMMVMVLAALVFTMIYALKLAKILDGSYYKNIVLKWIRYARYCIIPCVALNAIITTSTGLVDELVDLWIILWCIEYIWNVWRLNIDKTEVALEVNEGEIITVNSVVQFEGGKIKYTTLDKKEILIKSEYIHKICYYEEFYWFRRKEKVACFLEGSDSYLEFDSYKKISNDWIKFYVYQKDAVREVTILKNEDIKKIVLEGR